MDENEAGDDQTPDGAVLDSPDASQGFMPSLNFPGNNMGETNGLYAGNTRNTTDAGMGYFFDNPGGAANDLSDWIRSAASGVKDVSGAINAAKQTASRPGPLPRKVIDPSNLQAQWAALGTFEKLGFVLAIAGVLWALKKG